MKLNLVLVLCPAALLACAGRVHIEPSYARSYDEQFAAQRVRSKQHGVATAAQGLDGQEAAIMATAYRKSLAPKDTETPTDKPILLVAPSQSGAAYPLPSVPKE